MMCSTYLHSIGVSLGPRHETTAMTRTDVGTEHTFSQLGECIVDRDDVRPCDVLAQDARWPSSSDPM
jgi:hypothetical protein